LTPAAYRAEVASFKTLQARGVQTAGASKIIKFEAQRMDLTSGHIIAYACVDLTDVKVINRAGKDVTPKGRSNRQTSLPAFGMHGGTLKLEVNGTWSGDSIC
jgi:hypothetical protein